ncbi:unnamed protein product, partial [Iphiclides podalirius]
MKFFACFVLMAILGAATAGYIGSGWGSPSYGYASPAVYSSWGNPGYSGGWSGAGLSGYGWSGGWGHGNRGWNSGW